jgi:hypothetical protein
MRHELENSSSARVNKMKQILEAEEAWPIVLEAIDEIYHGRS